MDAAATGASLYICAEGQGRIWADVQAWCAVNGVDPKSLKGKFFIFDRSAEVMQPLPGDVMVFRYGRCYSHGGIVTAAAPLRIVHAYYQAQTVIEDEVARNAVLADPARQPRFFSVWAKKSGNKKS